MYNAYEDVDKGDRYRLEYTPTNQVTCLYLNNVKKVCESGLDFYRAFFGIWLSNYSVNKEFTDLLLGKDATN